MHPKPCNYVSNSKQEQLTHGFGNIYFHVLVVLQEMGEHLSYDNYKLYVSSTNYNGNCTVMYCHL